MQSYQEKIGRSDLESKRHHEQIVFPSQNLSSSQLRYHATVASCLFCVALMLNAIYNIDCFPTSRSLRVNLSPVLNANMTEQRPAIYAFYTKECDDLTLKVWSESWVDAGWDPVILSIEDVQRSPNYNSLQYFLHGKTKAEKKYYHSYIAMATVPGGGWLSELDVLPLNIEAEYSLPNQGKLTSHGAQSPSLISGSNEEWKEVVKSMISPSEKSSGLIRNNSFNSSSVEQSQNGSILSTKELSSPSFFYEDWCDTMKDKLTVQYFLSDNMKSYEEELYIASVQKWLQLYKAKCKSGRPVMFTFYEPVSDELTTAENMLEAWKEAWSSAGWEPFVLTNDDARRHPSFQKVKRQFQEAEFELSQSNYACYLRWFAMAASGGGWMSDYDVVPLNMPPSLELPNDGEFTGYERHVPCLLSGSGKEWDRMSNLVMNSLRNHQNEFWSDMYALKEMLDTTNSYMYREEATYLRTLYPEVMREGKQLEDPYMMDGKCEMTRGVRAVHFSYFDMKQIGFSEEELRKRDSVLIKWSNAWKEQCRDKLAPSQQVVVPQILLRPDRFS